MDLVWPDKDKHSAEHDVSNPSLVPIRRSAMLRPEKPETAAIGKTIRARVDRESKMSN